MNILGVSCFYHDAAAALLRDGEIVAAGLEERFTRRKHDFSFPQNAICFCLQDAGISSADVDAIAFYDKPFVKFERILVSCLAAFPRSFRSFMQAMPLWLRQKLWLRQIIQKELQVECDVLFMEHHQSHAASAFYPSPFESAAILTVDGVGEWATSTYGVGAGRELNIYREIRFPHSLGLFYSALTAYLGFRVNDGEYKVMGLASYGEPKYLDEMKELVHYRDDGSFRLNLKYFAFHYGLTMTNRHFHELFGQPPRRPDFMERSGKNGKNTAGEKAQKLTQFHKDVAASGQKLLEDILLNMVAHIHRETGEENLCLAGGVALNCVANGRILRESEFENIWVQPASSDAGGAIGAAAFVTHQLMRRNHRTPMNHVYFGSHFSESEIESFLVGNEIHFEKLDKEELLQKTVAALIDKKVVGWFQGRAEFGPRALGNRSILADPGSAEMKDILNKKVKHRELFRPFAPVILAERLQDYFDLDCESPYMLITAGVKKPQEIPAVTHVDNSARIQTINCRQNELFYHLLQRFETETGCPVLVNTSFNVRGEPIVDTPYDAYRCFRKTGIDLLVMGNFMITSREDPPISEIGNLHNPFKPKNSEL